MRVLGGFVFLLVVMVGCGGEQQGSPSEAECAQLRSHLIELRMQGVTADAEQHRRALEQALEQSFVPACTTTIDRSQWACAMAATTSSSLTTCNVDDK